jgi:hypothetical protein
VKHVAFESPPRKRAIPRNLGEVENDLVALDVNLDRGTRDAVARRRKPRNVLGVELGAFPDLGGKLP